MTRNDYGVLDLGFDPWARIQTAVNRPHQNDVVYSPDDDIEVIDLDDRRGQIKPTTWH